MSTLKTTNIQHPSASVPAITLDAAGAMTGSFPYPNRNLLYNSAMQVHQRGTSTANINNTNNYFSADRWYLGQGNDAIWTQSVENDAPTGSGFRKSLKMLVTTADSSLSADQQARILQILEGQDLQRIAKGTALAQQLTLSFWVKSNVTGTYIVELWDADNTRQVSSSYTINSSATWEKKILVFPADTAGGIFDNDNSGSLQVVWWLLAGSTFNSGTLNTSWAASTNANRAVGQVNLAASVNNYWQMTGAQLETGAVATPFEFKSYGQELRECQRYYQKVTTTLAGYNSATEFFGAFTYLVPTRAIPTAITVGTGNTIGNIDGGYTVTSASADQINSGGARIRQISSGMTSARSATALNVVIEVNAEL